MKSFLNIKNQNHLKLDSKKSFGVWGESVICKLLEARGFEVLQINYKKTFSEIDIIARSQDLIVFVEVKSRRKKYFNNSSVITFSKMRKILRGAKAYILENNLNDFSYRFDVAIIEGDEYNYDVNYIENAFMESDVYSSRY